MRDLVERLCAAGVDVAVVSGTHVGNVDGQLHARPTGPGRLLLALNRGSELFEVDAAGPHIVARRAATPAEDAALTRAARQTVESLAARGFEARIVSERLNRRKIDLLVDPAWADPPKSEIDHIVAAAEQRLRGAGIAGLVEVVEIALAAASDAGLAAPKVTSDGKHVEIGLTDKADSARAVFAELWTDGISADQTLIAGDEFGPLGGIVGSDSLMLIDETTGATVLSVGVEPEGLPDGIVALAGGPGAFVALLADQLERRGEIPIAPSAPAWTLTVDGIDVGTEVARASLLAISDGLIGTTAAPLFEHADAQPSVVAAGVYDGVGPATALLPGPRWASLGAALQPGDRIRRTLDLHSGLLYERVDGGTSLRSVRFVSPAAPGTACVRAVVEPVGAAAIATALGVPVGGTESAIVDGPGWMATSGTGGCITAALEQSCDGHRLDRFVAYVAGGHTPRPAEARGACRRRGRRRVRRAARGAPASLGAAVGDRRRRDRW